MSLNTIELKPQMLAGLYTDTLLQTSTTSVPESRPIKYLGNNQKNIVFIVSHSSVPFLPDNELAFVTNILGACKLSLADIAIVNRNNVNQEELELLTSKAKVILLFGTEPLSIGLPINFPPFQLQPFNARTYLYSPSLSELENDKTLKVKLWNCLKNLFGV
jgi:hypothetical protein